MNPILSAPIYDTFPSGTEIPVGVSPSRLIEPEIMFRVDRDLPPREGRYAVDEVMHSVTAVVGFEVIGSRYAAGASDDGSTAGGVASLNGALSDHLANGAVVIGDTIPGWRDLAFEDVHLRVTEDDREVVSVIGCHPFDDPFLPVVVGVNRLRRNHGARAGNIIVTNSSTSVLPMSAGTTITATYEGVGEVTASFAAA
jgi:2-keto-4-pentenoate hydratase